MEHPYGDLAHLVYMRMPTGLRSWSQPPTEKIVRVRHDGGEPKLALYATLPSGRRVPVALFERV
jgi:hypothetical protein